MDASGSHPWEGQVRLLPRMASEPPAAYVAFVAAHLEPLRRDATEVVGADGEPDELYPEVLTDVAVRWSWLQWRTRLGPDNAADRYLRRAFARRSQHWRADREAAGVDVEFEFEVWHGPTPVWSNAATRLAPYLRPAGRTEFGPICEAGVAWWHAYETRRRRRVVGAIVGAVVLLAMLLNIQQHPDTYGLPDRPAPPAVTAPR